MYIWQATPVVIFFGYLEVYSEREMDKGREGYASCSKIVGGEGNAAMIEHDLAK